MGTLHRFAKENPGADSRLLTHDTTPLYTAEGLGLQAETTPDGWLLDPERGEQTKKVDALQQEIARLKRTEPVFDIQFLGTTGRTTAVLEADVDLYDPPGNPPAPADSFSLSREQWRHASCPQEFSGEVSVAPESGDLAGALKLRIEAQNLSEPTLSTVPVRIRTRNLSCHASAARLVDEVGATRSN